MIVMALGAAGSKYGNMAPPMRQLILIHRVGARQEKPGAAPKFRMMESHHPYAIPLSSPSTQCVPAFDSTCRNSKGPLVFAVYDFPEPAYV
jgi:hypothetical protein